MRRIRASKAIVVLLSVCMMVLVLSTTAMAKSGGYVPTEGTITRKSSSDTSTSSVKMTYTKDGRITNYTTVEDDYTYSTNYVWSKNRLIRRASTSNTGDSNFTAFTYKKKRLAGVESQYGNYFHSIGTYTWSKGKSASVVTDITEQGEAPSQTIGTVKINGKKKIVSESTTLNGRTSTTTYKYYGNGNVKSAVTTGSIYEASPHFIVITNSVETYNKNGYLVSRHSNYSDGSTYDVTCSYVMDKKMKCPTQITVTRTSKYDTVVETWTFTNFQKVKRVRNCDDGGLGVPLGAN